MIIDVSKIEELFNSSITTYQIAKACDLSTQTLDRYRASDGKLENMSLKIALKIMNYIKQEEQEMKKVIRIEWFGQSGDKSWRKTIQASSPMSLFNKLEDADITSKDDYDAFVEANPNATSNDLMEFIKSQKYQAWHQRLEVLGEDEEWYVVGSEVEVDWDTMTFKEI